MEPKIELRQVSVAFHGVPVLRDIDLTIAEGEFLVLLGPSGCGKSTLLNAIAGLLDVSAGQVWIAGRNVTWAEPKDRGIAMVFQSYALYPAMDVYGNLAFALRVAGLPKKEIEERVMRAAELLELAPLLRRRPAALSGGQRQRVAIGRALVRAAEVFLFDEPLSNLDAQLRAELRVEIKQLHLRLRNTTVYVTHDQVEALSLADRIAVMRGGVMQQLADPDTVYRRPANRFVASFLGSPAMNFVPGTLDAEAGTPVFRAEGIVVPLPRYAGLSEVLAGRPVTLGIRPEDIVTGEEAAAAGFRWQAPVTLRESLGSETLLWSSLAGARAAIRTTARSGAAIGDLMPAGFDSDRVSLFDAATEERI
ncbi:MAG TPA: ABC transporter ATP-binding protein [Ramlibacter sp.]|uniref:ABC transporter ATP-binding protein n=1 Tax=Ramlibacter sp. TaxID=1917967 RepID=UPI002CC5BE16|nr:ABC transporter ATP-binding protein [Ramlibacter sp.]HVZ45848.1 ABC transporter ATP-binding protein [Ramlibacter sp.]